MSDFTNAKRLQHDSQKFEREVMSWQKGMSDTAHQREVKDLKKAGLNPILSATGSGGGGASSYTTSATDSGTGAAATWLSARQSAKATRYAAAQSASATRYAASVQAGAMVTASANNLAAAKYSADAQVKMNKDSISSQERRNPISAFFNFLGLGSKVDRNMRNIGTSSYDKSLTQKYVFSRHPANHTQAYQSLSFTGRLNINNWLRKMGKSSTRTNQNWLATYWWTGNKKYFNYIK